MLKKRRKRRKMRGLDKTVESKEHDAILEGLEEAKKFRGGEDTGAVIHNFDLGEKELEKTYEPDPVVHVVHEVEEDLTPEIEIVLNDEPESPVFDDVLDEKEESSEPLIPKVVPRREKVYNRKSKNISKRPKRRSRVVKD